MGRRLPAQATTMATECVCAVLMMCYMVTRHDVSRSAIFDARLRDFDLDALRQFLMRRTRSGIVVSVGVALNCDEKG